MLGIGDLMGDIISCIVLIILGVFCILGGIMIVYSYYSGLKKSKYSSPNWEETTAFVEDNSIYYKEGNYKYGEMPYPVTEYKITYHVDDKTYTKFIEDLSDYSIGSNLKIYYKVSDPEIFVTKSQKVNNEKRKLHPVAVFMLWLMSFVSCLMGAFFIELSTQAR